tara:strand:- start:358 stop:675 length:318 start_codon:yes stop_codon:yes gene_type:complete
MFNSLFYKRIKHVVAPAAMIQCHMEWKTINEFKFLHLKASRLIDLHQPASVKVPSNIMLINMGQSAHPKIGSRAKKPYKHVFTIASQTSNAFHTLGCPHVVTSPR